MKIAIIGTRGIPANYSGFETCAQQLGQRLVKRGHDVTVYCRSHHIQYSGSSYEGIQLIHLPTIRNKYLDTFIHTLISSAHALKSNYDISFYFIAGNSPLTWIPKLAGQKTLIHVDGLDWKREKWPLPAKIYLKFAEMLATKLPDVFVTDSKVVQQYFMQKYSRKPIYIPYGSDVEKKSAGEFLKRFNLVPHRYILFVGRLVPENRPDHLIEAFSNLDTTMKAVIVGDAPYAQEYQDRIQASASRDPRIIFTGYLFGEGYQELGSNAYLFVETSNVGGTHPALIEAMAFGNCVIVNNTPENMEVVGDTGFPYDGNVGADSLRRVLRELIADPEVVERAGRTAQERALNLYSWETITDAFERLFSDLMTNSE